MQQKELCKIRVAKDFRVEYHILVDEVSCGGEKREIYGVEVIKKQRSNGVFYNETKSVKHLTASREQIKWLVGLLAENLVTPITLRDILDDLTMENRINTPEEQEMLDGVLGNVG